MPSHISPGHWCQAALLWLAIPLLAGVLPAQHEIEVTGTPVDAPFAARAWADASRLVIDLDLQPDWHAYSRDVGGGEPVTLNLAKDGGVHAVGKLRLPVDHNGELTGRVRIVQWIRADQGIDQITATLDLMVCDPMQCLPPIRLSLRGKITPLRILLVASSVDDHARRTREFLTNRGLQVTLSTYDEVDTQACDDHDVVLAASKLFREDGKGGRRASSFPKTSSPIVAVGFLGTRLIEHHGLAMTSGYI